jgi:hypothetical protein
MTRSDMGDCRELFNFTVSYDVPLTHEQDDDD